MKFAAQLNASTLNVYIESSTWKKILLPFNTEYIKVERLVYIVRDKPVFHDAVSRTQPDTHDTLKFCQENLTVCRFKQELTKIRRGEPYEVLLGNTHFIVKKEFPNAYTITFPDYETNSVFGAWVFKELPVLDAALLLRRVKEGRRYCSREFIEFKEFSDLEQFTKHRFQLWHDATVMDFEKGVNNGTAHCEECDNEK